MTNDEIDKLEAGVELDRLVAKACAIDVIYTPLAIDPFKLSRNLDDHREVIFSPSRCWNDAMLAAEKCDLFSSLGDDFFGFIDRITDGGAYDYRVCCHYHTSGGELRVRVIAKHPSGPVAICRAILKASSNAST